MMMLSWMNVLLKIDNVYKSIAIPIHKKNRDI